MANKIVFLLTIILFVFVNKSCESILTDPLTILKNKIETTIDSAINEIDSNLNETNKQIDNISEKLINASEEFSQVIYNRVIRQLKKVKNFFFS